MAKAQIMLSEKKKMNRLKNVTCYMIQNIMTYYLWIHVYKLKKQWSG